VYYLEQVTYRRSPVLYNIIKLCQKEHFSRTQEKQKRNMVFGTEWKQKMDETLLKVEEIKEEKF